MKFFNVSNHPSKNWGKKQIEVAKSLVATSDGEDFWEEGEIIDIPFPNISPEASSKEVENIAEEVVAKVGKPFDCDEQGNRMGRNVVMVMGEFSCAFAITTMLLKKEFPVVVATTERKVEMKEGKKIVEFSFVKFRQIETEEFAIWGFPF